MLDCNIEFHPESPLVSSSTINENCNSFFSTLHEVGKWENLYVAIVSSTSLALSRFSGFNG